MLSSRGPTPSKKLGSAGGQEGAAETKKNRDRWFLSFDCATKSFAFALLRIREPAPDLFARAVAVAAAAAAGGASALQPAIQALNSETREGLYLAAGAAVDLVPEKKNKEIPTVERVGAAVEYLRGPVAKALEAAAADGCPAWDSPELNVVVEFQMGANAPARAITIVLLTHFAGAHTFLVGPAYKNKLWYRSRPDLKHCHFIERYKSLYTANKNHAKALYFDHIGPLFDHRVDVLHSVPSRLRKDFADCVLQVLGFLAYGDLEKAAKNF
ncbi:hypothetical protein ElyMa_002514500 [Elysia marginata]|uniref:Uncharacterized protein n=1 Tax=Elysia marginata TaxID=1093978 RepID=A0AAV4GSI3_9GAST|nr:hypothetical protein ElyMa_002514500 [Elysia marginata]